MTLKTRFSGLPRLGMPAILAGLLMVGCASAPPVPLSSLEAARSAVATAEQFEAGRFAAAELGDARQRLALADAAVRDEDMELAGRLATESQAGAELAYAKTEMAKAEAINNDMSSSAKALREEMKRSESPSRSGAQQ